MLNKTEQEDSEQKILRIAISGKSGCGNTTASRLVSEKLGIRMVNYTFRSLAEDEGVSFEEIRRRAELNDEIDRLVDQRQIEMAMDSSCILGSRLAIWMLKEADLRVYLNVNLEERVRRIHKREGGELAQRMQETVERDQLDHERYLRIYGINNDIFSFADIIINSSRLEAEQVANLIIGAIPKNYLEKMKVKKISSTKK
ncbi:MAG: (d)CMP kinase [Spirochaetia bacterium]